MAVYGEVYHTAVSAAERIGLWKSFLAEILIIKGKILSRFVDI